MSNAAKGDEIDVYLKDHYAGGIGALEVLEHSIKAHAGTPLAAFFADLRRDIKADHDQLHNLMSALGLADSDMRNAGAWLAEKFSRAKIGFSGGEDSGLRLLQTLESLALGITGKQLLWRALHSIRKSRPALEQTDFRRLEDRAIEQSDRVEIRRLETARSVFGRE
ncbi:MAG TPA: hypothetical protein VFV83_06770 [Chthoniobacteraceae bacterium]|nr:hypothetical protein [Chthoniobacteraceae bacterium]